MNITRLCLRDSWIFNNKHYIFNKNINNYKKTYNLKQFNNKYYILKVNKQWFYLIWVCLIQKKKKWNLIITIILIKYKLIIRMNSIIFQKPIHNIMDMVDEIKLFIFLFT